MYNSVGYIRRFYFALKTNVIYHIWFAKKLAREIIKNKQGQMYVQAKSRRSHDALLNLSISRQ